MNLETKQTSRVLKPRNESTDVREFGQRTEVVHTSFKHNAEADLSNQFDHSEKMSDANVAHKSDIFNVQDFNRVASPDWNCHTNDCML
jgi:hypothetical protein